MTSLDVAVVSRDPAVRLAAARAFDNAPPTWSVHLHESPPAGADVIVFGSDVASESDEAIVFDPASDGSVVDEVRRSVAAAQAKAFVVVGAGRGVGVTSLALHLSAAAARARATCFVDLDLEWGAAARLGMPEDHLTWDVSQEDADVRRAALPVAGGFRALLAPRDGEPVEDEALRRLLGRARTSFERVIVDSPNAQALDVVIEEVDAAVLVVPAAPAGARRAARILDRHDRARWAVVFNRLGPGGETTRAELHRMLGKRSAIELPSTPALRDAEDDDGLLTSLWSRYVRAVDRLLRALEAA